MADSWISAPDKPWRGLRFATQRTGAVWVPERCRLHIRAVDVNRSDHCARSKNRLGRTSSKVLVKASSASAFMAVGAAPNPVAISVAGAEWADRSGMDGE